MQTAEQTDYYSDLPLPEGSPSTEQLPGPNNPPWGSWESVGLWVISVAMILFVPAIFLFPYLASVTQLSNSEELVEFARTDAGAIFVQILAIIPAHLLTIAAAWLIVTRMRKHSFTAMLGWRAGGVQWWHYLIMLGGFFVVAAVVGYFVPEQDNDLLRMLRTSKYVVYIVAFVATFTAPLAEEVVYRGVVYSALQRSIGVAGAFAITTLLFAVVHVPQYWPSFSTIFLLLVLSVILTSVRVFSGNLLPCVILHTLFNGIQSTLLLVSPQDNNTAVPDQVSAIFNLLK